MQLHRSGRLAEASRGYRQAARIDPRNADALRLLGAVRVQQGRFAEAEGPLRKAANIDARSADLRIEHGDVLRRLGRPADAMASYRRAIEIKPDYAGAHNNLGAALHDLGRLDEAIASFRRAAEIEPGYGAAHYNLANVLTAAGRLDEAIASYRNAIALMPGQADPYNNLGNAQRLAGRLDKAADSYRRAIEIDPGHAAAHRNLGIACFEAGRPEEAVTHYRRALAVNPADAPAHGDLGNALRALGRFDEALIHYRKALAIDPNYADAHNNLGVALKMLGQTDAARQSFEKAVRLAPRRVLFYAGLADTKRLAAGDRHLAALEKLARDPPAPAGEELIQLHFTLAKVYADGAQHARSFHHLVEGNALKRAQVNYDEAAILGEFDRIRAVFTPELMQEKRGGGHPTPAPVFIIGMPRSGTTLVEQILASHPQVFGAGELSDFRDAAMRCLPVSQPYPEAVAAMPAGGLFALGENYLAGLAGRAPAALRITDKMPGNYLAAGLVHLALPNARIIHVRRDPIDTCLSCFSTLFAGDLPHAYDLGELGRYYRAYKALMAHWRAVLPEAVMIDVQYETLIGDFEREARRIVAHCGLDWSDSCRDFHKTERPVQTASMLQVRQPLYQSSVGRWRPYREWVGPLFAALEIDPREAL